MRLADAGLRAIRNQQRECTKCRGKDRHKSSGAAEAAVRSLIRRGQHRPEEGELNVYHCPRCLKWHVGHRHPKETRQREERGDAHGSHS